MSETIRASLDTITRTHPALCARKCRRTRWRGVQHSPVCVAGRDLIYALQAFIEASEALQVGGVSDEWAHDDFWLAEELFSLQNERFLRLAKA